MTRKEKFDEMVAKAQKIKGTKLYYNNQSTIEFHMKRLRAYFNNDCKSNEEKELLELDFDVSVKELEAILNQ